MNFNLDKSDIKRKKTLEALYGRSNATTLNTAIENFLSDLELTDTQSNAVAVRQKSVRERAENNALIDIEDSFLIGSYARDTQIKSLNAADVIDVDCMLLLKSTNHNLSKYWHSNDGGRRVLEDLQKTLHGYQGLTVKIDAPAVTITWLDMKMEIVPAFNRSGGGYLIPAAQGWSSTWQETSPRVDADYFTARNKQANGEFKPLIKMLKCWNRTYGKIIPSSFALETVLYHSIGTQYNGFEYELSYFFSKLREFNSKYLAVPSGVGKQVQINLSYANLQHLVQCENVIKVSYNYASQGKHKDAIAYMGSVFGKPFQGT